MRVIHFNVIRIGVSDLRSLTMRVEKNVFWFEVTVDDALTVQMFQRKRNFRQVKPDTYTYKISVISMAQVVTCRVMSMNVEAMTGTS